MNQFTEDQISALQSKKDECLQKKDNHRLVSLKYDKFDKLVGLPQIAISAFLSSLSVSNYSEHDEYISAFIAILSSFLVVLTSVTRYFEFGKLKESHKKTSISYGKLERFIEMEMIKTNKKQFDDIIEGIILDYNNIRENSYIIPHYIDNKTVQTV